MSSYIQKMQIRSAGERLCDKCVVLLLLLPYFSPAGNRKQEKKEKRKQNAVPSDRHSIFAFQMCSHFAQHIYKFACCCFWSSSAVVVKRFLVACHLRSLFVLVYCHGGCQLKGVSLAKGFTVKVCITRGWNVNWMYNQLTSRIKLSRIHFLLRFNFLWLKKSG